VALFALCVSACLSGGGPKNVLLVINDNSPVSQAVGAYYQQKRGIPDCNVCRIRCSTEEHISRTECETNIVAPIREFLARYHLPDRIDYIVLTKGIPLKASYATGSYFYGPLSVASVLTCVGEPNIVYPAYDPTDPLYRPPIVNPFGPTAVPAAPEQYFTHQLSFSGRRFYAVTRLDAYTEADIYRMIDDAVAAQPRQGLFVLDGCETGAYEHINNRLRQANNALIAAGYQTYYDSTTFDTKLREFAAGQQGVMGYFSWGSNESCSFTQEAYTSHQFAPGSIADSFVSFSGRTFTYPPTPGQSLIADLIHQGLSGCNGYVSEPNANLTTYPNVLFDRYLKGYNLAESFFAATPELYWKAVTIGDPLMAPYATPPTVTFTNPTADDDVHGTICVSVDAWDASGIRKVEFYIDEEPVAVCTSAPYGFELDTSGYPDGVYTVEAIAYEDSPVYTQGFAKINMRITNTPQDVSRIGDLGQVEDGRLIRLSSKVVTAGTDAFTDCIYLSEADCSGGVKVVGIAGPRTGDLVDIVGEKLTVDGQRVIQAISYNRLGEAEAPKPIGFTNRDIGNRGAYTGPGASSLRIGFSSTGLLVRTWGQVQQITDDAFYISDRSFGTASGAAGRIRVSLAGMKNTPYMPAIGSYVAVTGISALESSDGGLVPVLRPRQVTDIGYNIQFDQLKAPAGTVVPQWNLLSVPGVPTNPAASSVLAGINIDDRVLAYDAVTQGLCIYSSFQPEVFPPLCIGVGFWLRANQPYDLVTRVLTDQPDSDVSIGLPLAGSTLIGHPFRMAVRLRDCRVSDGVEMLSLVDAARRGWLDPGITYWDNGSASTRMLDVEWDPDAVLMPWHGYWVRSYRPNLALIVPWSGADVSPAGTRP